MTLAPRAAALRQLPFKHCGVFFAAALAAAALFSGCRCCETCDRPSAPPAPKDPQAAASSSKSISLFDGKTLAGWKPTDFAGHGEVKVENGTLVLGSGYM